MQAGLGGKGAVWKTSLGNWHLNGNLKAVSWLVGQKCVEWARGRWGEDPGPYVVEGEDDLKLTRNFWEQ